MKGGLGRFEKAVLMAVPVASVILAALILQIMFPNFKDLSGWFQRELSGIPYLVWGVAGGISGIIISLLMKRKPQAFKSNSRKVKAGFFGWLLLSIIISSLTEEGDIIDRLSQGPLFKAWAVLLFILVSASPTFMGILAVMTRKRVYVAGSVAMFFLIPLLCMTFSQAGSAEVLSQDPILSVLFIWSIICLVEGVNWIKRYVDRDPEDFPTSPSGKDMLGILWRRQLSYTVIFLAVASILAVTPFLIPGTFDTSSMWIYSFYESSAVIGKALISLLVLGPLGFIAVGRRYYDLMKVKERIGESSEDEGYL